MAIDINTKTLFLVRHEFTEESTIGSWFLSKPFGIELCNNIEDKDRAVTDLMKSVDISKIKVYGKTAVPKGTYRIEKVYSPKFKKYVWELKNIKCFDKIYIHSANKAIELLGCLAPGFKIEGKPNFVGKSRAATKIIYDVIAKHGITHVCIC